MGSVPTFAGYTPVQLGVEKRNLNSFLVILDNGVNYRVSSWQFHPQPFCIIFNYISTFIYHIISKYFHKNFLYTCIYMPLQFTYFLIPICRQTANLQNIGQCSAPMHCLLQWEWYLFTLWGMSKYCDAFDKVNKFFSWRRRYIRIGLLQGYYIFVFSEHYYARK